jgi:hypothetical protein
MTITAEAILQIVQVGILTGIFFRLGSHGAKIESMDTRVKRIEERNVSC